MEKYEGYKFYSSKLTFDKLILHLVLRNEKNKGRVQKTNLRKEKFTSETSKAHKYEI